MEKTLKSMAVVSAYVITAFMVIECESCGGGNADPDKCEKLSEQYEAALEAHVTNRNPTTCRNLKAALRDYATNCDHYGLAVGGKTVEQTVDEACNE